MVKPLARRPGLAVDVPANRGLDQVTQLLGWDRVEFDGSTLPIPGTRVLGFRRTRLKFPGTDLGFGHRDVLEVDLGIRSEFLDSIFHRTGDVDARRIVIAEIEQVGGGPCSAIDSAAPSRKLTEGKPRVTIRGTSKRGRH